MKGIKMKATCLTAIKELRCLLPIFLISLRQSGYLILLLFSGQNILAQDYDIRSYGAMGNKETLNTAFIQKAIDDAFDAGGGRVLVPEGVYLTGSIHLKTNVELHLQKGAVLLGSIHLSDYQKNNRWYALLLGRGQENISVTGEGTIDGQGREVVNDVLKLIKNGAIDDPLNKNRPGENLRPQLIELTNCSRIQIKNLTLRNAACWVQAYIGCTNLLIDSIQVESTAYWNNDGMDLIDSKDVVIKNCVVNAADDGICLKSDNAASACERIEISNCKIRSSASAIKFGTASYGGFKNINIHNIYVYDTYRTAIALEMVDGGIIEDVTVSNLTAKNSGGAFFIRLGHRNQKTKPGIIRRIRLSNLKVEVPEGKPDSGYQMEGPVAEDIYPHNPLPSSIAGLPGYPVQEISLENIAITYRGGADKNKAYISLDSVQTVPERAGNYPEFNMFGELPSWGVYVRHVNNLQMKNVKLLAKEYDYRPALVFDDVHKLSLQKVSVPTAFTTPVLLLYGVRESSIKALKTKFRAKKR